MRNIKAIAAMVCLGLVGACATDEFPEEQVTTQELAAAPKVKIDIPENVPSWLPKSTVCDLMETTFVMEDIVGDCVTIYKIEDCSYSLVTNKCNCKYSSERSCP